jgi:hypothetical protein
VIISRKKRWVGHVTHIGRGEVFIGFWLGGLKGRDCCEDLDVGGRITLIWTLWMLGLMGQSGFGWLAQDRVWWQAFVNTVINLLFDKQSDSAFQRISCITE